jgi:hypothetical protein
MPSPVTFNNGDGGPTAVLCPPLGTSDATSGVSAAAFAAPFDVNITSIVMMGSTATSSGARLRRLHLHFSATSLHLRPSVAILRKRRRDGGLPGRRSAGKRVLDPLRPEPPRITGGRLPAQTAQIRNRKRLVVAQCRHGIDRCCPARWYHGCQNGSRHQKKDGRDNQQRSLRTPLRPLLEHAAEQ